MLDEVGVCDVVADIGGEIVVSVASSPLPAWLFI